MPTLRAKPEDKFSQARAAKNSPERQEAARKRKDTPPKSVQAEQARINALKKKTPRGPSSVKPKVKADPSAPKLRDEDRVFNLVVSILKEWRANLGRAENTAASAGIIKVSRRQIEGALRDLKNTRFTKIPVHINDILTGTELCEEFGYWVYVEHDSPDWLFVKLPDDSTPVLRMTIDSDRSGETSTSIQTSSEPLLESVAGDKEIEILECNDRDIEDLETKAMRKELIDKGIIKPEAADKLNRPDLMKLLAYYS